jgi:hypothetical protein
LASVATAASDLAAALGACVSLTDTVIVNPAALVTNAAVFANLAASGAGLTVVATPNLPATVAARVVSRGLVILDLSTPTGYRQPEPGLVGVSIAAVLYGRAGTDRTTVIRKVAATP